mgnify:CR=1 FL=1
MASHALARRLVPCAWSRFVCGVPRAGLGLRCFLARPPPPAQALASCPFAPVPILPPPHQSAASAASAAARTFSTAGEAGSHGVCRGRRAMLPRTSEGPFCKGCRPTRTSLPRAVPLNPCALRIRLDPPPFPPALATLPDPTPAPPPPPHTHTCSTCNCCYSLALQESHVCVQNSMHQNCPVCFEYLFDSVRPITVLPCGHTIHQASAAGAERGIRCARCASARSDARWRGMAREGMSRV